MPERNHELFEVLIVGAGPVGLFLAHLLGRAQMRTLILERQTDISPISRAIGITPPSLHLMQQLGLDDTLTGRGVRINEVQVFDSKRRIALLNLGILPYPHNFILSLPETITLEIFETGLRQLPSVVLRKGCNVDTITDYDNDGVEVRYRDHTGWHHSARACLIIGCDGEKSTVRNTTHIRFPLRSQTGLFVMGDTVDSLGMGSSARLYFTAKGAIESFPLPQGQRRWVAQIDDRSVIDKAGILARCIHERTGAEIMPDAFEHTSIFGLKSAIANRYFAGNLILCGDACHVMSPVGGQGMNIGFGDAYSLSQILIQNHRQQGLYEKLTKWQSTRKKAALTAIRRASINSWIGTRTGPVQSGLRSLGIRLALNRWTKRRIANHFAMWTIPYSNFRQNP